MTWPEDKNIGYGVSPDYEIPPTIDDLLKGSDAEIEFILNLIKKTRD
jgi:hypothetical protein